MDIADTTDTIRTVACIRFVRPHIRNDPVVTYSGKMRMEWELTIALKTATLGTLNLAVLFPIVEAGIVKAEHPFSVTLCCGKGTAPKPMQYVQPPRNFMNAFAKLFSVIFLLFCAPSCTHTRPARTGALAGNSVMPFAIPELHIVRRLPGISLSVPDIRISGMWTAHDFKIQVNNRTILSLPSLNDDDSAVVTVYTGSRSRLFIDGPYSGGGTFSFFQSKERCVALYGNRGAAIYPNGEVYEVVTK